MERRLTVYAALAFGLSQSPAHATHHGTVSQRNAAVRSCHWVEYNGIGPVPYSATASNGRLENISTTSPRWMYCAQNNLFEYIIGDSSRWPRVYYEDRNPGQLTTDAVYGWAELCRDFECYFTEIRYSCATPGGCLSPPPAGYASSTPGYLEWPTWTSSWYYLTMMQLRIPQVSGGTTSKVITTEVDYDFEGPWGRNYFIQHAPVELCNWTDGQGGVGWHGSVENPTASQVPITCGITDHHTEAASTTSDFSIAYVDAKPGAALTDSLYCVAMTCSLDGLNCVNHGTRYSCATAGGCTSPVAYSDPSLEQGLSWMNITKPAGGVTTVRCHVPGMSGEDASYLTRVGFQS